MTRQTYIMALAVEAPPYSQTQAVLADQVIRALPEGDRQASAVRRIYDSSNIKKRHSVVDDFSGEFLTGAFLGSDFPATSPGMTRRNELYKIKAPALAHAVAEKALLEWGGSREDITHVVSVSCTGLIAPGIEFLLVDSLELPRSVQRLGVNFMGCFGAFKGLAVAKALAMESPDHRVLVVCTELCSLHFHLDGQMDTHVANALFADGAAAVMVGCEPRAHEKPLMEIVRQGSLALTASRDLMTWEAADEGLVMRLSPEVPKRIDQHVVQFAKKILGEGIEFSECDWALHPGGKAILKAVEKSCGLVADQTASSWKVMRDYGNMSSATFLFVLDQQRRLTREREFNIGMGFGPGLSMEGILLRWPTS